jgi:hypothetical protein
MKERERQENDRGERIDSRWHSYQVDDPSREEDLGLVTAYQQQHGLPPTFIARSTLRPSSPDRPQAFINPMPTQQEIIEYYNLQLEKPS